MNHSSVSVHYDFQKIGENVRNVRQEPPADVRYLKANVRRSAVQGKAETLFAGHLRLLHTAAQHEMLIRLHLVASEVRRGFS